MGQQQEIVAGSSALRRMILVLVVASLMAAMMLVAMAAPAFAAQPNPEEIAGFACFKSDGHAHPFGFNCR
jgi:hypothetical protein